MDAWQFWGLFIGLGGVALAVNVAAHKICAKIDMLNWTLSDIRAQQPETIQTLLNLPSDIADQIENRVETRPRL